MLFQGRSCAALLAIGLGKIDAQASRFLLYFIAANFALNAAFQIVLAITSNIAGGLFKLFQWVFSVLIALFAFHGAE